MGRWSSPELSLHTLHAKLASCPKSCLGWNPSDSAPTPCIMRASFLSSPPFFSTFFQAQSSKNTRGVGKPWRVWLTRSTLPSRSAHAHSFMPPSFQVDHPLCVFGTPRCSGSVCAYLIKPGKSFSQPCPHLLKFFLMLNLRTNQLSPAPVTPSDCLEREG